MALFNFSLNDLVKVQLPARLIKVKIISFMNAIVSPVTYLYNLFRTKRDTNLYNAKKNPQITKMQGVLNDRYDLALRRIKIIDGESFDPIYIYRQAELKPVFLYKLAEAVPKYLYQSAETAQLGIDFVVQMPDFILYDEAELKALIDDCRLASKLYLIQQVHI